MNNPIPGYVMEYLLPIVGDRMLELGRKKVKIDGEWITYKSYFESQGVDHTSIDIQGGFGALPLDLTQPIDLKPFDMVTNIGTTEHVSSQEQCWRNIHNLTKVGGVIVSMTPLEGDWWWHGNWYPKEDFFESFTANGYTIDEIGVNREAPCRNLAVRMTKVMDAPFVMPSANTIFYNKRRPR